MTRREIPEDYLFRRVEKMVDGEASGNVPAASLSDSVLTEGAFELLSARGRHRRFSELSPDERDGLMKELKYRYSPSDKQLARVVSALSA